MKRTTVWALALVLAGMAVVSCDGTTSPPPQDDPTDTTGTNTGTGTTIDPASIEMLNPKNGDTTIPNDVTTLTIKFKTNIKPSSVVVKAGATALVANTLGEYTYAAKGLQVGLNSVRLTAYSTGKVDTVNVSITRQLTTPIIRGLGGQADQTDFTDSVQVQFAAVDNATTDSIRYSTNGATAKISSSDPLVRSGATKWIKGTTTFRAIALRRNGTSPVYSDTVTVTFIIGKTLSKPYFSTNRVDSSNYETKIGIGGFGINDTVRYTSDGGDPTRDARIYSKTDSILIQDSSMIIAKSFNGANQSSPACTTSIKLKALGPVFSIKSGMYTSERLLSIKSPSGVPVYYTTDGTTPTSQSLKAGDTLLIDSNVTLKAFAYRPGWRASKVDSVKYKFKVATPTLSFSTGNYDTTQLLGITDSAAGASIHYLLGSLSTPPGTPNCHSALYDPDSMLRLDSNVVLKAIACKDGWDSSATVTGRFTFKVAKITFVPDSAVYRNNQVVILNTRSPGVTFYVTRDSTAPAWDASGALGATQKKLPGDTLLITKSQWLRVVAARNGWAISSDDARRYIVEGDTLLVDDFEQNSLTRPVGFNWRFWACGYCENTGISDQMETKINTAESDWDRQKIGFRAGHISLKLDDQGARRISDGRTGPAYAGFSVGVPSNLMGETYRIAFWARWKPKSASVPSTLPLVTEMAWSSNDKQNGYYHDGFKRYIEPVGPTWQHYILDYSAFFTAANSYEPTDLTDSTTSTPKSYWIIRNGSNPSGYPDSSRMLAMGLSKFQGQVTHAGDWKPGWVWNTDHDLWIKNEITAFRWSVLQPNTDKAGLSALTNGEWITMGYKDTLVNKSITDGLGTRDTLVASVTPRIVYCGDCHQPTEPGYSDALKAGFVAGIEGDLEIDRIQLIRRPQPAGGVAAPVAKEEPVVK